MHIGEGVLQGDILLISAFLSTALLAISLKKLRIEDIPKVSVLSAVFF